MSSVEWMHAKKFYTDVDMGRWTQQLKEKKQQPEPTFTLENITNVRLSELAKLDIALQIYSDVLGCEIWLCYNEAMATQVRKDDPGAVIYTIAEVKRLIFLNPDPDDIRRIHATKALFPGSKIINSRLQEG
ncbi:MAG TPA: hypothetical protein VHT73_19515 [Thermodesulfobacteriota bacterium]|nr:hypothetical protein [Thermodesulfobacteriota bacterium]